MDHDSRRSRVRRRHLAIGSTTLAALIASALTTIPGLGAEPAAAQVFPELPDGHVTHVVSQTAQGQSTQPYLTSDGQRVAFTSTATDLVDGDTNGVADVFLTTAVQGSDDPFSGPAVLVSRPHPATGQELANGPSGEPVVSANGRYVAFTSTADNLVDEPTTPGRSHVYVRDTRAGTTFRVQAGDEPDGPSYDPDISDDGRYLVFTSEATNLVAAPDGNDAPDAFLAELDSNGDGTLGDLTITRFVDGLSVAGGTFDPVISGNGEVVAFTAVVAQLNLPIGPQGPVNTVYYGSVGEGEVAGDAVSVHQGTREPALDATGQVLAYVDEVTCNDPMETLRGEIVAVLNTGAQKTQWLGWALVDRHLGAPHAPTVSADGSVVAWQTTQPRANFDNNPTEPLAHPAVRIEEISWFDAFDEGLGPCQGILRNDWYDIAPGEEPSLSASGRSIAYADPRTDPPTTTSVRVMDRHNHEGLWVSALAPEAPFLGYMSEVDIASIPLTQLRDYASALADAPIHRLPIHRLPIHRLPIHRLPIHRLLIDDAPIHRLPIHRLPIHRLPIHRLDIPGGWTELLAGTPFAAELIHTVTLDQVLTWVEETLADGSGASPDEIAAAERIRTLSLADVELSASGIDGLSLASFVLGSAPLAQVPIPGTGATPTGRWQALLDAQGIAVTVDGTTVLAELDSAGLAVGRTGLETVPLSDLPPGTLMDEVLVADLFLEQTPLGELDITELSPAAQAALFGPTVPAGTLAEHQAALLPGVTVADLAAGAPSSVTVGTLLLSLLDAESYPWEQIESTSIPHQAVERTVADECGMGNNCEPVLPFSFTFDSGPGEPTSFPAPTASVSLPVGTTVQDLVTLRGSGPLGSWRSGTPYPGPVQIDGELVRFPLADTLSGTTLNLGVSYTISVAGPTETFAEAELRSGEKTARYWSWLPDQRLFDDPASNRNPDGTWEDGTVPAPLTPGRIYYGTIKPEYIRFEEDVRDYVVGPADDEDYYLVAPPPAGHRLVVSTNATDGEIVMELYTPASGAPPAGVTDAGPAPGVGVTEPSGPATAGTQVGADAGAALEGHTLVDQVKAGGGELAQIEAASADVGTAEPLLLRVTSGTGRPTDTLYSIRVRHVPEPAETRCAPRSMTQPGSPGISDEVTAGTNTLYLVDTQRFTDAYGATATADLRQALRGVDAVPGVQSAVIAVDADEDVRTARGALDANPCSMEARRGLVRAINVYVRDHVGPDRLGDIESVVLVGGDDMLPHLPVPQRTGQFNEASHASSLRLPEPPGGGTCPEEVADGEIDPCATPLSVAAATNHILTDDAYGLASAYRSLGGHLYVPTTAVGRLVETPEQIQATIERFVDDDGVVPGVLPADSTLTGGYGAWAELPDLVTEELAWRTDPANRSTLVEPWDRDDVIDALGDNPRVVSINTHADETRMLPGVPGAPVGRFAEADLLTPGDIPGLGRAIVFLIGCHAAQNLPSGYYGDVPDWADVFSQAAGYVGNTGFGLANNRTTALSERLLSLYAGWLGTQTGGTPVTAGQALTYAKQAYLGGLGLYSGYDEKVLMQAVYYGLPMYTLANSTKELPLPTVPTGLTKLPPDEDGLVHAALTLSPQFDTVTDTETGETYKTADGQDPLVVAGQPVLPRVVHNLGERPAGFVPRGALITELTSVRGEMVIPAIAEPSVGSPDTGVFPPGASFPSTFATISQQDSPAGVVDLLVVTPGRVQVGADGRGFLEEFTGMTLDVTYAPDDSEDVTPPVFTRVEQPPEGSGGFRVKVDGTGSEVQQVRLLTQVEGTDGPWTAHDMFYNSAWDEWTAWVDAGEEGSALRWIIQAVDEGGNVATESGRGQLPVAAAAPPVLPAQADATVVAGERFQRTVTIDGVGLGERLTGRYAIRVPLVLDDAGIRVEGGEVVIAGPVTVTTGPQGVTRAELDAVASAPGAYEVVLEVCRGTSCAQQVFLLTVVAPNSPPTASVVITSDTEQVELTSVLTANAGGTDPDGDPVTLSYAWSRNGIPLTGETGTTLELAGLAAPGDTLTVTVTPHDGTTAGHAGVASVNLGDPVEPLPEGPTITLEATADGQPYVEGEWSQVPVTVTFSCTSVLPATTCPEAVTASDDTPTDGVLVSGAITDQLGRTVTAQVLVRVDGTPPVLAPTVTPATVPVGGTAQASANATDASSGVAEESCDPVDTSTAGAFQVECRATDEAGNTATGLASYEVVADEPGELTVTVEATSRGETYEEGTWSKGPVQVRFRCESDVQVVQCPRPVTVAKDTGPEGQLVTGTARDAEGRTVTVEFLVRVDKTPPKLEPTVTPSSVPVGGAATASPNATDGGSGVASATCDPVDTSRTGKKHVWCHATDHAGNTAKAKASYTVVKAGDGSTGGLTVTVKATAGGRAYAEGTWSRKPVKVTFSCSSDVKVTTCPKAVTVSKDTGPQGTLVTGKAKDKAGRTVTATFVVKVDRTAPRLKPVVTPSTVPVGGNAAVSANATDRGSGVVDVSCGKVPTDRKGKHTVRCQVVDAAGNKATATAKYTVTAKTAKPPKPPKKPKKPKHPKHIDRAVHKVIQRFWEGWD